MLFIPGTFSQTLPSNSHKTYTYEEERTRHMGEVEQLVRRSKKRNPDAFTELMQLHERDMYRTASAILSQDADIADAMQEKIWQQKATYYRLDDQGQTVESTEEEYIKEWDIYSKVASPIEFTVQK